MTTPKQAAIRMNGGHFRILENLAAGREAFPSASRMTAWEIRGAMKVSRTLVRWGAVSSEGGTLSLTEFGREVLEECRRRWGTAVAHG